MTRYLYEFGFVKREQTTNAKAARDLEAGERTNGTTKHESVRVKGGERNAKTLQRINTDLSGLETGALA